MNPESIVWESMPGDGSDRTFYRVRHGTGSAVLVYGKDRAENQSYELIGRHFWRLDRMGPEFLSVDLERGLFLVEDLGSFLLQDWVRAADEQARESVYRDVVDLMAKLHGRGIDGFDPAWCYQTQKYDRKLILERETGYFLSAFVYGLMNLAPKVDALTGEFEALADAALKGAETVLMHRDFQSRNVMIKEGRPRMVDFQGARPGPPAYDLASLLYDPYVDLSEELRGRLLERYCEQRKEYGRFLQKSFRKTLPFLAVCRLLQALGAYGFLTSIKGKFLFEKYIPAAVERLNYLLEDDAFDFAPKLRKMIRQISRQMEPGQ